MKKKWILCALAILFIISEGERNGLRNDNRGGDCNDCGYKWGALERNEAR